jgi:ferric-dicitrate binding protein FerR (iron transport regulator)
MTFIWLLTCRSHTQPQEKEWSHWCGLLDRHTAEMRKALDYWRQMGAEAQKEGATPSLLLAFFHKWSA